MKVSIGNDYNTLSQLCTVITITDLTAMNFGFLCTEIAINCSFMNIQSIMKYYITESMLLICMSNNK